MQGGYMPSLISIALWYRKIVDKNVRMEFYEESGSECVELLPDTTKEFLLDSNNWSECV